MEELKETPERKGSRTIGDAALRTLFTEARTAQGFLDVPVARELLERIVELAELGPTSNNSLPLHVTFVESPEAKERLRPALSEGNVEKTMRAPVTAILAADVAFHLHRPERFPDAARFRERYGGEGGSAAARALATTNATLQGAYLMLAARALGLDVGRWAASSAAPSTPRSSRGRRTSRSGSVISGTPTRRKSARGDRA
jgi:3-hydroxypropanoate dehydrogenase